jgi:hypothetical protein
MEPMDPTTYSLSETARLAGISKSSLFRLRRAGKGPAVVKLGRRVVVRAEALTAWLSDLEIEAMADEIIAARESRALGSPVTA